MFHLHPLPHYLAITLTQGAWGEQLVEIISEVTELLNSRVACRLVFLDASDVRLDSSPLGKTVLHLKAEKQNPGLCSLDASITARFARNSPKHTAPPVTPENVS